MVYCFHSILPYWNLAFNQSSYQYFNKTRLQNYKNKLIGRGTPSGKGRDHPSRRAKKSLVRESLSFIGKRLRSEFAQGVLRHGKQICVPQITPCCYLTITWFHRLAILCAASSFWANISMSLLTFKSVILMLITGKILLCPILFQNEFRYIL